MQTKRLKIINGKILTPGKLIFNGTLLVTGSRITAVAEGNMEAEAEIEIDAGGQYVSPGFIDIHVHGGGGHDFMDGSVEAYLEIARLHARYGTTSMTPTTLTSSAKDLEQVLSLYEQAAKENTNGAQFIGMHLEGPYIAPSQCGAQDTRYIHDPDPAEYESFIRRFPFITRWSAAPELPGALQMGKFLRSNGILPAIAHTDAIYEEVVKAFDCGFTHATHFYSAMSGISRRNGFRFAGVIESGFLIDDMTVEIIVDGVHLPAPLLQLVYKIKGSDKTALITDAMRAAGMPAGPSILGGLNNGTPVIVEDEVAKLPDRSSFAGSVATADRLVRNMCQLARVPLIEAVKMISKTPAVIMGLSDSKGSLERGKDADIVIFDEAIEVSTTVVMGNIIYSNLGEKTDKLP
jgi:N-acetylglucosamine-6-phosphate deacetylase